MTGLPGLPVGVAGLGPAGASPYLEALGGDSTDRQHSRHESLHTVTLRKSRYISQTEILLPLENSPKKLLS